MVDIQKHLEKSLDEAAAISTISSLLRQGKLQEAVAAWAEWDWVAPYSIGRWQDIDFRTRDNIDKEEMVSNILSKVQGDRGIYFAVMTLLGEANYTKDRDIITATLYQQDLRSYRENGFTAGVQIQNQYQTCTVANTLRGCYQLEDAPDIPSPECQEERGCTCGWLAIFEDEEPPSPWKKP
jgi:hypothetical protein